MSIKPHAYRDGSPTPWEYLVAGEIPDCQVGMALTVNAGKLEKATGATKPTYISMYGKPAKDGEQIPVIRVHSETVFATQYSVDADGVEVGDLVTIDATGTMATATTADGVLEVVELHGSAAGDEVLVRIP